MILKNCYCQYHQIYFACINLIKEKKKTHHHPQQSQLNQNLCVSLRETINLQFSQSNLCHLLCKREFVFVYSCETYKGGNLQKQKKKKLEHTKPLIIYNRDYRTRYKSNHKVKFSSYGPSFKRPLIYQPPTFFLLLLRKFSVIDHCRHLTV